MVMPLPVSYFWKIDTFTISHEKHIYAILFIPILMLGTVNLIIFNTINQLMHNKMKYL